MKRKQPPAEEEEEGQTTCTSHPYSECGICHVGADMRLLTRIHTCTHAHMHKHTHTEGESIFWEVREGWWL